MSVNCLRAMTILSVFLISSFISVQSKVVVIPMGDGLAVIPLATGFCSKVPAGTILCDELTDGKSSGTVKRGVFTEDGWKHVSGEDKIVWGLDQTMEAGIIEFELTGMHAGTRGGYTGQRGSERAYYFGLFNDSFGNKATGSTAFIEIRYNWGSNYTASSAVKLQAGTSFRHNGDHHEEFGTKRRGDWQASSVYKHRVVFGNGQATLYIDGQYQTTVPYRNRTLRWNHIFLGDVNYAGISGPDNVTYRNLLVIKTQ